MSASIRSLYSGSDKDFVYFEKQGRDRLCGLHCINNLLQGPFISIDAISRVGQELDRAERRLLTGGAEGNESYTNVSADGFFSVTVIDSCLATKGFKLTPFNNPALSDLRADPAKQRDGFICNLREHWFAVREVRGRWFSLNSLKPAPESISEFNLSSFIGDHMSKNWSVFVIRHKDWPSQKLPATSPQDFPNVTKIVDALRPLVGNAFLSFAAATKLHEIEEEQDHSSLQKESDALNRNGSSTDQTQVSKITTDHEWPKDGGRTVTDNSTRTYEEPKDEEDPIMKQVMLDSASQFQATLPDPEYPPIPDDADPSINAISIRITDLAGQMVTRRFDPVAKMTDLFHWLHKDPLVMKGRLPLLVTQDEVKLITAGFPRKTIIRRTVPGGWLVSEQGQDISLLTFSERFPFGENLRMIQ